MESLRVALGRTVVSWLEESTLGATMVAGFWALGSLAAGESVGGISVPQSL